MRGRPGAITGQRRVSLPVEDVYVYVLFYRGGEVKWSRGCKKVREKRQLYKSISTQLCLRNSTVFITGEAGEV